MKNTKTLVPVSVLILVVALTACSINPIAMLSTVRNSGSSDSVVATQAAASTSAESQPSNSSSSVIVPSTLAGYEVPSNRCSRK